MSQGLTGDQQAHEWMWKGPGSETGVKPCHLPSSAGNRVTMELATAQDENPCDNRGSGVVCQPLAPGGTKGEKWRRRESNPGVVRIRRVERRGSGGENRGSVSEPRRCDAAQTESWFGIDNGALRV